MKARREVTREREIRETMPSLNLAVAGALARGGWDSDRIADVLHLPPAFAELLCDTAIRDGERTPGDDARLIAAVAHKVEQRSRRDRDGTPFPRKAAYQRPPTDISRGLLAWNLVVLLLAVTANVISDIPRTLRAILFGAAFVGLLLTARQARRHLPATARGAAPRSLRRWRRTRRCM